MTDFAAELAAGLRARPRSVSPTKMPIIDMTCHEVQLTAMPPQKYGTCSGAGRASGKRFMKMT